MQVVEINKQVIDLGFLKEKETRSYTLKVSKPIHKVKSCGCIKNKVQGNYLTLTYKGDVIPFHIDSKELAISKTVKIIFKDESEEQVKITAIVFK